MLNAGTPARSAIDRTTFDQVHGDTPAARLRGDSETNNAPRADVIARRCARYPANNRPATAEYGTTRDRRLFVVSARIVIMRCAGSRSSVASKHSSSRRSAAS